MSNNKKITKAVILAGGKGTRFKEYTKHIPKPLVQLGPYPIIIHIMKRLHKSGIREFVICGGYKIRALDDWFIQHANKLNTDVEYTEDYVKLTLDNSILEDTVVTIVNTGEDTGTAQRIKAIQPYLDVDEDFVLCYGDSVSDVDFNEGYNVFEPENKLISICAIPYRQQFGLMRITDNGDVTEFQEKPQEVQQYINGGYMLVKYKLLDYIAPEHTDFSKDTLESSAIQGKISAYIHRGYWKAIDSEADLTIAKTNLEKIEAKEVQMPYFMHHHTDKQQ